MTVRNRARAAAACTALAVAAGLAGCSGDDGGSSAGLAAASPSATAQPAAARSPGPTPAANPTPADDGPPSATRKLARVTRLTGDLTPKSVVASPTGHVVANNMIYTHTVSVFDSDHELVTTLRDRVTPAKFGFDNFAKPVRGGPVEAAFSPDGKHLWVSNYSMYGPGFSHPGDDV